MFFAAHFSSQSVSVPIMHSNSFVLPPKGPSFQYLPYSPLISLISFLPSLILYKYLQVSPTFSLKFLFSVSVPVLTLPNFQTPSDLDQPKIPKVPMSPQSPKNRPRPPAQFSFDNRQSRPQKHHQVKPRPKDKPSVTDVEAAWSMSIYPYSLVEHATAPRRERIWIQLQSNWYRWLLHIFSLLTPFLQPSILYSPPTSRHILEASCFIPRGWRHVV